MTDTTTDAECNWAGCAVNWDDVGCPECGKYGYGFDSRALMEDVTRLREALEFAEARSRQPDEGHTAFFERLAAEFYRSHGYLAPGKDDPLRTVSEERAQRAWEKFLNEPVMARRAVLNPEPPHD